MRCVVASDRWHSLSEAIDQVLVSLTCASFAPCEAAADGDTSEQMNSNGFGRVRSPSNELASIWSVGAERSPPGIA